MINNNSIGIFDSGLGGLTVLKEIKKILPNENIIYLGDTARVPYGVRSPEVIKKFSEENVEFLLKKDVKCIVIACNTSSAVAGEHLKNKYKQIKIFDVITPTMRTILNKSKTGVIGTRATIKSNAYNVKYSCACSLFVPIIEEGEIDDDLIKLAAKKYLKYFKGKKIENLIMGCTHYSIIEKVIQTEVGNKINLINPAKYVTLELKEYLTKNNLLNNKLKPSQKYYVTDLNERFLKISKLFLGYNISSELKKTLV